MRKQKTGDPGKKPATQPLRLKEDIQQSNDERIDQDFPGYPHHPARDIDRHNGSANAFEGTEKPKDDED